MMLMQARFVLAGFGLVRVLMHAKVNRPLREALPTANFSMNGDTRRFGIGNIRKPAANVWKKGAT